MSFSSSTTRTVRLTATSGRTAPVDRARMLAHDLGRAPGEEPARRRDHDDRVVYLTDSHDHVRDQVEREDDVRERADQHRLRPDRHPPVAEEPPVEADEVREV